MREDMLTAILSDLNGTSADIEASAVISTDGLMMARVLFFTETTAQRKISYPTSSILTNSPFLGVQSVMSMIADLDKKSCTIKVSMSLMQDPTCYELPEFCEEKNTETLTNNDFTCEQTLRARALLASRQEESCKASRQTLSTLEVQQINNPKIYLLPSKLAVLLPKLNSMALDEACNCTYEISDEFSTIQYKLPALTEHCLAHFSESSRPLRVH